MATTIFASRPGALARLLRSLALLALACLGTAVAGSAASAGVVSATVDQTAAVIPAPIGGMDRPFVSVKGRAVIAPGGERLRLKGINLANWLVPEGYMFLFDEGATSPRAIQLVLEQLVGDLEARKFWRRFRDTYITRDDIRFIKDAGFNVVRIPFSYRLFVGNGYPPPLEGVGYRLLDRVIGWCREAGLYVILDMHAAPGGQTGSVMDDSWGHAYLYEDAASQELTIRLWRKLAERYRDERIVIGYDLLNEPIADYLDTATLSPKLEPLYQRITEEIRQVDPHHLIIVEGPLWGSDFSAFGAPFDDKLVYSFHKYWVTPTRDAIQPYLAFRNRYDVPLFMGESGEADSEWIRSLRSLLEANDIGWAFWPYKRLGGTASVLTVAPTEEWEAIAKFAADPVATIKRVQSHRPPKVVVTNALNDFLENIRLENCRINTEYLDALGIARIMAESDSNSDGGTHD